MLYRTNNNEQWVIANDEQGFAKAVGIKINVQGKLLRYCNAGIFECLLDENNRQQQTSNTSELINQLRPAQLPYLPGIISELYDLTQITIPNFGQIQVPHLEVDGISISQPVVLDYIGSNAYGYGYDFYLVVAGRKLRICLSTKGNRLYQRLYTGSIWTGSASCGATTNGRCASPWSLEERQEKIKNFLENK